jgi:hypothetical protein
MVLAFWDVLALIPTPTIFQNLFFSSRVVSFICLVLIPFSLLWDCALESEPWDSDLRAHRSQISLAPLGLAMGPLGSLANEVAKPLSALVALRWDPCAPSTRFSFSFSLFIFETGSFYVV